MSTFSNVSPSRSEQTSIGDLGMVRSPVDRFAPCEDIDRLFATDPSLRSVLMSGPDEAPALLMKEHFQVQMSGPFGYSLRSRRAVHSLLECPTLVVDAHTSLAEVTDEILDRCPKHRYDDFVVRYPNGALGTCSVASVLERISRLREHQALHDALTKLPNRLLLLDRIERALSRLERSGGRVGLLFCDLDRFKVVNDSLGHRTGDLLLCAAAERLTCVLRETDTAARLGGDEFVVLFDSSIETHQVVLVAERILEVLSQPFIIGGNNVLIACSIGIAWSSDPKAVPEDLLRDADLAMYRAKAKGGNRYELFDQQMGLLASRRMRVESRLRAAVKAPRGKGALEIHYQPKVDLSSLAVVGFEGLLRWNDEQLGQVPPPEIITVAEESGLIQPLSSHVLQDVAATLGNWGGSFHVSMNLSAREFQSRGLVENITTVLGAANIDPSLLRIEITEGTYMSDVEAAIVIMHELKKLGVKLAVDDFGTGYSSLAYLQRFPVDELKIDRAFVTALGTERKTGGHAVVEAMIALAHALELEVTAEGIETRAQLEILLAMGCDVGQGYLFSKPLPAQELQQWAEPITLEWRRGRSDSEHSEVHQQPFLSKI